MMKSPRKSALTPPLSRKRVRVSPNGFTLIEVLVALTLLALMSVAAWRGLDAVIQTRDQLAQETRKWQHLALFFSRMEQDIAQAVLRPVRDRGGHEQAAWVGNPVAVSDDDVELMFTRSGMPDQGAAMRAPQRIGYHLQQGSVMLLRWPHPDAAPNDAPLRYPLLDGVREFRLRYLDLGNKWHEQWPPDVRTANLPLGVEVQLTLDGGEVITRVFALQ